MKPSTAGEGRRISTGLTCRLVAAGEEDKRRCVCGVGGLGEPLRKAGVSEASLGCHRPPLVPPRELVWGEGGFPAGCLRGEHQQSLGDGEGVCRALHACWHICGAGAAGLQGGVTALGVCWRKFRCTGWPSSLFGNGVMSAGWRRNCCVHLPA